MRSPWAIPDDPRIAEAAAEAQRPSGPARPAVASGRHDPAALRRSKRAGRERGCWVYVPAEFLADAGIALDSPPPAYRVWAGRRRTLLVQLYERSDDD